MFLAITDDALGLLSYLLIFFLLLFFGGGETVTLLFCYLWDSKEAENAENKNKNKKKLQGRTLPHVGGQHAASSAKQQQ